MERLTGRFEWYLKAIVHPDLDSLRPYTYPKLFDLVSQEEVADVMQGPMGTYKYTAKFDSIKRDTIYPIFQVEGGKYTLALFTVRMKIISNNRLTARPRKKTDTSGVEHTIGIDQYPAPPGALMRSVIYNDSNVELIEYDDTGEHLVLKLRVGTIAAKDKWAKRWSFITIGGDQKLLNSLFSIDILKRLPTFNQSP